MTASRKTMISSVENVISAVGVLAGTLKTTDDLAPDQKVAVLGRLGEVATQLKAINEVLFTGSAEQGQGAAMDETAAQPQFAEEGQFQVPPGFLSGVAEPGEESSIEDTGPDEAGLEDAASPRLGLVINPVARKEEKDAAPAGDADPAALAGEERDALQARANNLKLIDGIDEQVEALLNEEGIYRFEQIAAFREADIIQFSDLLNDPFRAARQNWAEQARMLADDIPTRYSSLASGVAFFDRLQINDAYGVNPAFISEERQEIAAPVLSGAWQSPERQAEVATDGGDEADGFAQFEGQQDIEDSEGADIEGDAAPVNTLLEEKAMLEAELASLRHQLAAHQAEKQAVAFDQPLGNALGFHNDAAFAAEPDENEPEAEFAPEAEEIQHEYAATDEVNEEYETYEEDDYETYDEDEAELGHQGYEGHAEQEGHEGVNEGAMWHDEVSLANNYQPPSPEDLEQAERMQRGDEGYYSEAEMSDADSTGYPAHQHDEVSAHEAGVAEGIAALYDGVDIRQRQDEFIERGQQADEPPEVVPVAGAGQDEGRFGFDDLPLRAEREGAGETPPQAGPPPLREAEAQAVDAGHEAAMRLRHGQLAETPPGPAHRMSEGQLVNGHAPDGERQWAARPGEMPPPQPPLPPGPPVRGIERGIERSMENGPEGPPAGHRPPQNGLPPQPPHSPEPPHTRQTPVPPGHRGPPPRLPHAGPPPQHPHAAYQERPLPPERMGGQQRAVLPPHPGAEPYGAPLDEGEGPKKANGVSAGFRLKARQFAESLQKSFVSKETD